MRPLHASAALLLLSACSSGNDGVASAPAPAASASPQVEVPVPDNTRTEAVAARTPPPRLAELELSAAGRAVIGALGVETVDELTALKESEYFAAAQREDASTAPGALREINEILADMGEHFAPEGELVERDTGRPARTAPRRGFIEQRDEEGRYRLLILDEPTLDQGHFPDANMWSWRHGEVRISVQVRPAPGGVDPERLTGIQYLEATLSRGEWGMFAQGRTERSCFSNLHDADLNLNVFATARGQTQPDPADCETAERLALSLRAP